MPKLIITEYIDPAGMAIVEPHFDIHYDQDLWKKPDELASLMPGFDAMIVRFQTQVRGAVLDSADALQCVGRLGVGLDNIDTDACKARGIAVYPATGANSDSVAELALGGIFVLFRNAYHVTEETLTGNWPRPRMMGREVMGKTLGIMGFGSIGRALAWRAKGVGMRVVAWDPFVPADAPVWAEMDVEPCAELNTLLAMSDAVSVHVPLTDETRDLIDAQAMSRMKPDAYLLNLARGGIVNEADLAQALKSGAIGGAFLDAFVIEPLPADNVFHGVPNLFLTPHAGARTVEADLKVCTMVADAVRKHVVG